MQCQYRTGVAELSYAKIGNQVYPEGSSIIVGQGEWNNNTGASSNFSIAFNPNSTPIYASLFLENFDQGQNTYYLKSIDAMNIIPDPDYYDLPPDLVLTFENNMITGSIDSVITLSGTY